MDLNKCTNNTCPMKETCQRWVMKPGLYQFYSYFIPDKKGECVGFREVKRQTFDKQTK